MTKILTFCAASAEGLPSSALELLAAGRRLADQLEEADVLALLVGAGVEDHAEKVIQHGADQVFVVSHPRLETQEDEIMLGVAEMAVRQLSPDVIIFPHDELSGGHVAPRLAHRLGTAIVTECTDFEVTGRTNGRTINVRNIRDGAIRWLRPVYGGKAMAYMSNKGPVELATIRALSFDPLEPDTTRQGQVQSLELDVASISPQVALVDQIVEAEEFEGLRLDQADIIVSGGRGMDEKENFAVLRELADILGAAVGGSRPAADLGWVPHSHLVGQTGKIVAPNLYIAVAISGAPQHMSGAGSAKTIVAINKDEDAPIFKVAHIGVVDEWQNVIPTIIDECKKPASD